MGQEEVIKVLRKSKKPLNSKEISEITNVNLSSTTRILKILTEKGDIKRIELNENRSRYKREWVYIL